MSENDLLWNSTMEEIVQGYKETKTEYCCSFCGKSYKKGQITKIGEALYDAYGSVVEHVKEEHGCAVDYLLELESNLLGISEVQRQILKLMADGKSDAYIAQQIGIAQSTVRNHRFKLREKEKQAKLYLALMESLQEKTSRAINESDTGVIEEVHQTATMVDLRYNITDKEREKTIKTYMDETGAIKSFPAREKKKIIILGEVMKNFVRDREYTEHEVNSILERMYSDYATIRRSLIEYGFFDRSDDCHVYRVKE